MIKDVKIVKARHLLDKQYINGGSVIYSGHSQHENESCSMKYKKFMIYCYFLIANYVLISMVLFSLVGNPAYAENKFKVITTFTIIQDMAKNIAGEAAIVESITKPGAEIHGYQPTPGDIVKVQSADLILWNGLHLESWFERFFDNIKKKVPKAVVTEGITPLSIREALYQGAANPHAWMSPSNALIYIDNILRALVEYNPINAKIYQHNAKMYAAKITALDSSLRERLACIPADQRYLVTSEGAFSYLAKDYDFKELYLWPINAEEQGSARQMQAVIDQVRQHKIPIVFSESTISDKSAKQISKETGARYGGVLYVDSLSDAQGLVPTYIDLLNITINTIAKGFNK